MKKRIVWIAAALLAAIVVLAAALCRPAEEPAVSVQEIAFLGTRDILRASLDYDEGLRTLRGTQSMTIVNRTGGPLSEIVLRVSMNAQDEDAVAVSAMTVDGQPVSMQWEDPTTLRIAYPWEDAHAVTLSFTLMIKHEKTEGVPVITLPSLAMFEEGAWRTDAYDELVDPTYSEAFDFAVSVDGQIAAQMSLARDASFALEHSVKAKEKKLDGVTVRTLGRDAGAAGKLMEAAEAALESLREIGLEYLRDRLVIADSETARADGAVYSGLAALSTDADKETLTRRLTRLIARQTFGILIENDPWNAPWLSETLASSAELIAYRARKGAAAYEERLFGELELATRLTRPAGVSVGGSTAHFGSDSEMTQVLRDQGAAMLLGIEQAVGEEAFMTALDIYAGENMGETGSLEALCSAFALASGSSWDGYISDMLSF